MSDLQLSLLVAGVVVVAGVYLFNWRQERSFRRKADQAFTRDHEDVLLREPASADEARVEPKLQTSLAQPGAERDMAPISDSAEADPVIDYVVDVSLPQPHDGADLGAELLTLAAGWSKPVQVCGYDADSGEWKQTGSEGGAQFRRLRFALQMSNRAGCVDEGQLRAFRDAVLDWAQRLDAEATSPDVTEAHARAAELDRFCAEVDIAIGISVISSDGGVFSGTKIRALAEAGGLRFEPEGTFCARDDDGELLFALDNHEPAPFVPAQMKSLSTRGITFVLDVPRARAPAAAFETMLATARSMAVPLGGVLVDDNRAVLSDAAIDKIRRQLHSILAKMEAGQIAAGGARALRLFR